MEFLLSFFKLVHYIRVSVLLCCICAVVAAAEWENMSIISLVFSAVSLSFYVFILALRLKAENIMKYETISVSKQGNEAFLRSKLERKQNTLIINVDEITDLKNQIFDNSNYMKVCI